MSSGRLGNGPRGNGPRRNGPRRNGPRRNGSRRFGPRRLAGHLAALPQPSGYAVAWSGGADSTALLLALAELGAQRPAPVRALHIDHGLHPDSPRWAEHCAGLAGDLGIEYVQRRVTVERGRGDSPEDAARRARYAAFEALLRPSEALLTGHHRNDQAETVMLALLRGSGVSGLGAMAPWSPFGAGYLARPLLAEDPEALRAYLRARRVDWIEDPSNRSLDPDRNFLRQRVLPLLAERWPGVGKTLGRSAELCRAAADIVAATAATDLAQTRTGPEDVIDLRRLQSLPAVRQRELLREWCRRLGLPAPQRKHLATLLSQLDARPDAESCVRWPGAELRIYRDRLYARRPQAAPDPEWTRVWDLGEPLVLPAGLGALRLVGAEAERADLPAVTVTFRRGGERLRPVGARHRRELRLLFQEAGIPPWERARMPLLWHAGELVAVGDRWLGGDWGERLCALGLSLVWEPRD